MSIGMLWFDNDSKTSLEAKIKRAVDYYRTKYNRTPTTCFVHPTMLMSEPHASSFTDQDLSVRIGGVEVRGNRSVLPNHFWIGVF